MLTDAGLRALKPQDKPYKKADRAGLYAYVTSSGTISFRFNYAINGRQETLVLGRYGPGGIKLSEARELLMEAKASLAAGRSPARQKSANAARRRDAESFGLWAEDGSLSTRWRSRRATCGDQSTSATSRNRSAG